MQDRLNEFIDALDRKVKAEAREQALQAGEWNGPATPAAVPNEQPSQVRAHNPPSPRKTTRSGLDPGNSLGLGVSPHAVRGYDESLSSPKSPISGRSLSTTSTQHFSPTTPTIRSFEIPTMSIVNPGETSWSGSPLTTQVQIPFRDAFASKSPKKSPQRRLSVFTSRPPPQAMASSNTRVVSPPPVRDQDRHTANARSPPLPYDDDDGSHRPPPAGTPRYDTTPRYDSARRYDSAPRYDAAPRRASQPGAPRYSDDSRPYRDYPQGERRASGSIMPPPAAPSYGYAATGRFTSRGRSYDGRSSSTGRSADGSDNENYM
ncbi:hypothetical protein AURDEDRAFT_115992 [Auricularia subglabra TFB-10046 SS5]|nr:hypothetical protein AURDEDRAFT_115992 [Auricularia subglabra TFB-10046 SS5]